MPAGWIAAGSALLGAWSSSQQAGAAKDASDAQVAASQAGIAQQGKQFDAIQALLAPYVNTGTKAIGAQGDLVGLNGVAPQGAAIDALQKSPLFTSLLAQGTNSILQNASATGGLRGGNTQAALAQFSPALLAQTINDQYSKLGGLTSIGQNAAAGVGNAGIATGNQITSLLQQQGAAQAGNALAQGKAQAGYVNSLTNALGQYYSMNGGF